MHKKASVVGDRFVFPQTNAVTCPVLIERLLGARKICPAHIDSIERWFVRSYVNALIWRARKWVDWSIDRSIDNCDVSVPFIKVLTLRIHDRNMQIRFQTVQIETEKKRAFGGLHCQTVQTPTQGSLHRLRRPRRAYRIN